MLSRRVSRSALRAVFRRTYATATATSAPAAATSSPVVAPVPVKRVGALRGGLLGFFAGVSATSAAVYFYVLDEYKDSSNVIIKDVLTLTKSIRVLEEHVRALEQQQEAKK